MRFSILFGCILLMGTTSAQQLSSNQFSDTVLYNPVNYISSTGMQQVNNFTYEAMFSYNLNTSYKMKKVYLDSAGAKLVSKSFYHQGKLHGPFESYAMDKLQAKGRYSHGKLDGERITYYGSGTIQEKANFKNGKREGAWEYYDPTGRLMRRVTYNSSGGIEKEEQF